MERHCHICGYPFALLIPVIHNQYLATQISILFDLVVENGRAAFFVCHHCKEIVANMYEFYLHIKKTQSFVSSLTDEQKQINCRMCGCCYEDLQSLFELPLLIDKIYKLYKVKITKEDKLPTVICEPCKEIISNNWSIYICMNKSQETFPNEQPNNDEQIDLELCNEASDIPADSFEISIPKSSTDLNNDKLISENHETTFINLSGKEIAKPNNLQDKAKEVLEGNDKDENTSDKAKIDSSSKHIRTKKGSLTEEYSAGTGNTKKINEIVKDYEILVIDDLLKHPRCHICMSLSTDTVELQKHYNSFHNEKPWCESDKFCRLFSMYRYIVENRRKPEVLRDRNGEEVWSCMCCKECFRSKLKMFHHERHSFLKKFQHIQCGLCSRFFFSKTCYNYHQTLHMKLLNSKCDKCNKCFLFMDDLNTHIRAHEHQFTNTCPICELDFKTPWSFQEHWIIHTYSYKSKPYPFYCGLCGRGHATRELTSAHLATHILNKNVKPFL